MSESAVPECREDPLADLPESVDPQVTGGFTLWFADGRWEWSPEVYRLHGYEPGAVEPSTELVLAHNHPDDRDLVAALIDRARTDREPFAGRHRVIDTRDCEHTVLVVANRILDADGEPIGTSGCYIDLTDTIDAAGQAAVSEVVPEIVESRAVIEQAKGILMRMYGISADQAFKVLSWRSQETNTKLRALAAQLVADLPQVPPPRPDTLTVFDHLLLTGHERIPPGQG
ncbi:PAS and ANTAR domain-containing protein [Nocardia sp. NPDC050697]|uniref:PAS and ANTAR domain-containing protein n=1 Tax=Nocardia sp. NPDC050697 TaxID=3155158 RepID=UPI0033C958B1